MSLYKPRCTVCQVAKKDIKFRQRVRWAAFKRTEGDETLADLGNEFGLSIPSMYNHAKKHITDNTDTSEQVREAKLAKAKLAFAASVQKENELALNAQTIDEVEARPAEIVGLDEYIAQGVAAIRKGQLAITPSSFLGAVKVKTEWSAKQQNNKLELMRTMMAFASGNKNNKKESNDDTTIEVTASSPAGEDESSDIFRAAFGNAPTQGSEEVYREETSPRAED